MNRFSFVVASKISSKKTQIFVCLLNQKLSIFLFIVFLKFAKALVQPSYDVCVVGGGVMGAASAAATVRAGASCILVEQFQFPGHERGSSDGDGRIYRYAYAEDHYLKLMERSLRGWTNLEQFIGRPLRKETGHLDLICSNEHKHIFENQIKAYTANGLDYERLGSVELQHKFPQIKIPRDWEALYQKDAGVLYATETVKALLKEAEHYGCSFEKDCVVSITPRTDEQPTVRINLASGTTISCNAVILAAGSWTNKLLQNHPDIALSLPIQVTHEIVSYFEPQEGTTLGHTISELPTFIARVPNGHSPFGYYGIPIITENFGIQGVKVAAHCCGSLVDPDERVLWKLFGTVRGDTTHSLGATLKVEENNFTPTLQILEHEMSVQRSAQELVQKIFPQLNSEHVFASGRCLYSMTPDHDFILDKHPVHPEICIAAGFSGHGFKFGYVVGEIMACLALKKDIVSSLHLPATIMDKFTIRRFQGKNIKYNPAVPGLK